MSESTQPGLYVVGSINTDMVVKAEKLPAPGQTVLGGDFFMSAGGKGGNQAVAAARLGAQVSMIANLGTDIFGDAAIARLQAESVDTRHVSRDDAQPSGVALISVDDKGENHIVVAPGANNTLIGSHIQEAFDAIPAGSIILLQLEIPLSTVEKAVEVARDRRCRVVLDPAPAQPLSDEILSGIFVITPNESEAEILTGIEVSAEESALEAARVILARGVENAAITLGSKGALLANQEGWELVPAPNVSAADSTAAGDCFNGSMAVGLARGLGLSEAVAFACRAAAVSVTRLGAQDSMPFAEEIE